MLKTLKYGLMFSVAFAALMSATPGKAQTANSESTSGSNSTSSSGSISGSRSSATGNTNTFRGSQNATQGVTANTNTGVTLNQTSTTPETQRFNSNTNYTGGTNNYSTERQTGDVTIRSAPQVYAPPVSGGNPCTLAVSGGISVIGWGAAAGGTFVDEDCATRQKIAMVWNAGFKGAAKELMCNDQKTYVAFKTAGEPCALRQQWEAAGTPPAPMVQMQPTVVTPAPQPMAAPKQYPRCNAARGIVDNCVS